MKYIKLFSAGLILTQSTFSMAQSSTAFQIKSPIGFVENKGQIVTQEGNVNSDVLFFLAGNRLNLQLRENGFSYDCWADQYQSEEEISREFHRIDVSFDEAKRPELVTSGRSSEYNNYYLRGSDVSFVYGYQSVTYSGVYEGIDIEFRINAELAAGFEYLIHTAPGADLNRVRLKFEGQNGLKVQPAQLTLETNLGPLTEIIPASWTMPDKEPTGVVYTQINENTVGFHCLNGREDRALVIDPSPIVAWATYYGGSSIDSMVTISSDSSDNSVYITGRTESTSGISTSGTHQASLSFHPNWLFTGDVFLAKFSENGEQFWGTYFGGEKSEIPTGSPLVGFSKVFVNGRTSSSMGIAHGNAYQNEISEAQQSAYLACFNDDGTISWATYFGATESSSIEKTLSDNEGIIFCGGSSAEGIALNVNEGMTSFGGYDAILGKFSPQGDLLWCRYFGGTQTDYFNSIQLENETLLVDGRTASDGLATSGAPYTEPAEEFGDFLARFDLMGNFLEFTYLPTNTMDAPAKIFNHDNSIYHFGTTYQTGVAFGTVHQLELNGISDAFIAKYGSDFQPQWLTYFGGPGMEYNFDSLVDESGLVYVVGDTRSSSGISTADALQPVYGSTVSSGDGFLAIFSPSGQLMYGTYFGGTDLDRFHGAALNGSSLYISGSTRSPNLATPGAHLEQFPGDLTGLVLKIDLETLVQEFETFMELVNVYPNPLSKGNLHISSEVDLVGWMLTDNRGLRVQEQVGLNSKSIVINTSQLSAGVYYLRLTNAEGQFVSKKVVIE